MEIYFIALAILIFGTVVSLFIKEDWKMKACAVSLGVSVPVMLFPVLGVLFTGGTIGKVIYLPYIFGSIEFIIDPLSAFFILVISVMCFLGTVYAAGYIKPYLNKGRSISSHCLFLMTLILSMLLVVTVQNALLFLIVWEIMSLSSFFLVMFESEKQDVRNAGLKYMIYMHMSVIFLIAAFAYMNIKTSSLSFTIFTQVMRENPQLSIIAFILAFMGFGIKSGFVPFHNWLPDAHPAAPSHISGIMSGVMIKTGIYGILRMLFITGANSIIIPYIILIVSVISIIWGVLYAIGQHDIKRLLAYSSIENIGVIGIGIGIGTFGIVYDNQYMTALGYAGAILHILNHSIFKELLFFAAGSVYKKTHTREVERLGGLIKKMPYTAVFFIIGSVAICALPPFNGFISEFFIYAGMIMGINADDISLFMTIIISLSALALIGTMAMLCFSKVSGIMFLGKPRSKAAELVQEDVENVMLVSMGILSIMAFFIGIFPQYAMQLVLSPMAMFVPVPKMMSEVTKISLGMNSLIFIFLLIIGIVFLIRKILNKKNRIYSTWGCGYNKPNVRMQYTASSYADLFISTLKPLFKRVTHIKKPKEIFPKEAYYKVEIEDIEEAYIVKPLIKLDEEFLRKFEKIQNGNMQQYILFGLIFLVLTIAGLIIYVG